MIRLPNDIYIVLAHIAAPNILELRLFSLVLEFANSICGCTICVQKNSK